jgi:hypothetical protein
LVLADDEEDQTPTPFTPTITHKLVNLFAMDVDVHYARI